MKLRSPLLPTESDAAPPSPGVTWPAAALCALLAASGWGPVRAADPAPAAAETHSPAAAAKKSASAPAATQAAAAKGVQGRTLVSKSDMVSHAIIHAAEKNNCDLIVMASHGRRGIKRLLLGSETQHVLTHSSTPVLVLR